MTKLFLIFVLSTSLAQPAMASETTAKLVITAFSCVEDRGSPPNLKVSVVPDTKGLETTVKAVRASVASANSVQFQMNLVSGAYYVAISQKNCFANMHLAVLPGVDQEIALVLGRSLSTWNAYTFLAGSLPSVGIDRAEFHCAGDTYEYRGRIQSHYYYLENIPACAGTLILRVPHGSGFLSVPIVARSSEALAIRNILIDDLSPAPTGAVVVPGRQ